MWWFPGVNNIGLFLFRICLLSLQFWTLLQIPSILQVLCPAKINFCIFCYRVKILLFSLKTVSLSSLVITLICNWMLLCFCKEFVDSPYKICWHSLVFNCLLWHSAKSCNNDTLVHLQDSFHFSVFSAEITFFLFYRLDSVSAVSGTTDLVALNSMP